MLIHKFLLALLFCTFLVGCTTPVENPIGPVPSAAPTRGVSAPTEVAGQPAAIRTDRSVPPEMLLQRLRAEEIAIGEIRVQGQAFTVLTLVITPDLDLLPPEGFHIAAEHIIYTTARLYQETREPMPDRITFIFMDHTTSTVKGAIDVGGEEMMRWTGGWLSDSEFRCSWSSATIPVSCNIGGYQKQDS